MVVFAWKLGKNYFLILKVKYLTKVKIWRTTTHSTPIFSPTRATLTKFLVSNFRPLPIALSLPLYN